MTDEEQIFEPKTLEDLRANPKFDPELLRRQMAVYASQASQYDMLSHDQLNLTRDPGLKTMSLGLRGHETIFEGSYDMNDIGKIDRITEAMDETQSTDAIVAEVAKRTGKSEEEVRADLYGLQNAIQVDSDQVPDFDPETHELVEIHNLIPQGPDDGDDDKIKVEHWMYFEPHTGGKPEVRCTCGWKKAHTRRKVLVTAVQRHEEKTGHIWRRES